MRKLIAITMLCFLSLLLTNEKAISKSSCDVINKTRIAKCPVTKPGTDAVTETFAGSLQYDGFFKKL
jgi:hypothetical protein